MAAGLGNGTLRLLRCAESDVTLHSQDRGSPFWVTCFVEQCALTSLLFVSSELLLVGTDSGAVHLVHLDSVTEGFQFAARAQRLITIATTPIRGLHIMPPTAAKNTRDQTAGPRTQDRFRVAVATDGLFAVIHVVTDGGMIQQSTLLESRTAVDVRGVSGSALVAGHDEEGGGGGCLALVVGQGEQFVQLQ